MGAPVKFIKCTLAELQEREPDAKKVDIYMKDGTVVKNPKNTGGEYSYTFVRAVATFQSQVIGK